METVKNLVSGKDEKSGEKEDQQFAPGHKVPVTHQDVPGHQDQLPIKAQDTDLPTDDGGYQAYRPAGKLLGKKALITGGDSGIGRAVAIMFAMEGADSAISYLPEEERDAQDVKKEVEKHGRVCHLIPADLTVRENCKLVADAAVQKLGKVNILVNNAAYQMMQQDIQDISDDQWYHTFQVNIHAQYHLSKYLLPQMSRGDTIINNASINAYVGRPDLLDYTTTKGAIISFTRGLANQQMSKGIRVNAVAPGPVWTPLIPATMDEKAQSEFTAPLGRPAQPSEIATSFVFLASADSSMISGQTLHPNGGTIVNG